MFLWRRRLREFVESLKGLVALAGLGVALAGVGILGWQVVRWLRTGAWEIYSAYRAARAWAPRAWGIADWLRAPDSWYGFHEVVAKALKRLPTSLALIAAGTLIFVVFIQSMDSKKWRE